MPIGGQFASRRRERDHDVGVRTRFRFQPKRADAQCRNLQEPRLVRSSGKVPPPGFGDRAQFVLDRAESRIHVDPGEIATLGRRDPGRDLQPMAPSR